MTRRLALVVSLLVGVGAVAAAKGKAKTKAKLTPLTDAEKQTQTTYRTAMQKGRKATTAKDYPTAIAAFGDALAAKKDDPEALAERGFAELLAKDYDAATKDLEAAKARAASSSQQGMIWFNLGLVAEARGDDVAAQQAYATSNTLRPSKAAAKKLAGKTVCAATIDRAPRGGIVYATWVLAAKGLAKEAEAVVSDDDNPPPPPATEAEAKASLCGDDGCPAPGPWIVTTRDSVDDEGYHLLVQQKDGKLLAFPNLGGKLAGRCASQDAVSITGGDPLQVVVVEEPNDMVEVDDSGADLKPCESNGDRCSTACFYSGKTDRDLFFDLAHGKQVLAIERPEVSTTKSDFKLDEDFQQKVSLKRGKDGVVVKGAGCDQTLAF